MSEKQVNVRRSQQRNPWLVLLVLCFGFFMILLDLTIVNIAIPSIIDGLKATLDQVLWVLNAYILVYAVLLITAGRLGDMFGPKWLFLIGMGIFTLASIACSLAQDPNQLIAARVVQGVGGALLTPQTLTILTNIFSAERRGAAFGVWGAVAGIASVAGPTLGGFLITHYDWRAIFWINVPVGIVALGLGIRLLPDLRNGRTRGLDPVGVLVASGGLFALTFALIEGQRYHWGALTETVAFDVAGRHWTPVGIPGLFILSGILFILFLLWERGQRVPLVPFSLFRRPNFAVGNALAAVVSFGMLGLFLPLTIFLQSVLGFSAQKAGLTLVPMSVMSMLVAPFAGRATDRFGGKYLLMTGLSLFALGMGLVIWFSSLTASALTFTIPLIVAGFGFGFTLAPMATVTLQHVDLREAGAASGVLNTIRQLGGVIGSAAVGAILQNRLAHQLVVQAQAQSQNLPPTFRSRFVASFTQISSGGLEVGPGQSGASLPAGIPPQLAPQITQLAHNVFATAFLNAMRPSLAVPIGVLVLGVVLSALIVRHKRVEEMSDARSTSASAA